MLRLLRSALATAIVLSASCAKEKDEEGRAAGSSIKRAPEETATRVEVAVLETSAAASSLVRPGEVVGAREANLGAALGGYVESVMVESGQSVTKGQVLARIDSRTHGAQVQLARVELDDAKRELERVKKLGKSIASARVDAAETRLARAQAQQRVAATHLDRATIKAPFAGVLVDLSIEQGEVAAPGQPIGRLLLLDPIAISVSVTDQDVQSLQVDSAATVTTAGSPTPIAGRVTRIEPAADLKTRTFLVEVQAPNPERKLLPGMIATVSFQAKDRGSTLLLPQDLLVTKLKANGVFVVGVDSTAQWRALELGEIVGSQVEVLGGIARGERIVTVGMRSLSEGDKVIIARQGVCCTNGSVTFDIAPESAAAGTPTKTVTDAKPTSSAKNAGKK